MLFFHEIFELISEISSVFIFDNLHDGSELEIFFKEINVKSKNRRKTVNEAIEAQTVYNVRHKTDKWYKFQHEIHFYNLGNKIKEIAFEIYEK